MKNLNRTATKVFCTLLERTNAISHKFLSEGFMPLTLSKMSPLHGEGGKHTADLYQLAHTFLQYGDTMHDPAMDFIVMGYTKGCDPTTVIICPASFRQDTTGHYSESVRFNGSTFGGYYPREQADQTYFANIWLRNIKEQGFLQ
ncbi:DUF6908 domain-containing protein [Chitinophaga sp. Ak27]|uniref:DUF6908 domain-containing protein n=1 Tax=Chitinophaga sp. Ak27 TaxID=2726116 RepID=UPI003977E045